MESFTWTEICLKDLQEAITPVLNTYNIPVSSRVLYKRNKDLKDGDMIMPRGQIVSGSDELREKLKEELMTTLLNQKWKVSRVTFPSYCFLAFHFHRETMFRDIVTSLWESDILSEKNYCVRKARVFLNLGRQSSDSSTLDHLRNAVLLQHIFNLLTFDRYDVSFIPQPLSDCWKKLLKKIGLDTSKISCDKNLPYQTFTEVKDRYHLHNCRCLIYKEVQSESKSNESTNATDNSACEKGHENKTTQTVICKCSEWSADKKVLEISPHSDEDVSVDFKLFMEENNVKTGKGNYDKSLKLLTPPVSLRDGTCTDIMNEVVYLQNCTEQVSGKAVVAHVTSEKRFYHEQKVDLLWKALFNRQTIAQVHINFGVVTNRQGTGDKKQLTAEEFIGIRFKQMKDAAIMKYGDKVKGTNWDETITSLTVASLKFEFLMTSHRNMVKLDLSSGHEFGGGVDNRAGAFVMYNCARLATLFKHFEENVDKGVYPPLPDISTIDFTTLREEDEWELLYNYIYVYIDLITESTEQFLPEDSIISKIHTHKVCNFLLSLSRSLSSYYSRTHILGENRPHLLPVMYARLYLLKVVHRIMCHGLHLMGIVPLNQL